MTLPDGTSYAPSTTKASSTSIYSDQNGGGLADIAFYYWATNLRTDLTGSAGAVKPYTPFDYAANELPDPFKPSKIEPDAGRQLQGSKGGGKMPDFNRKKEPLEAFPLETLKMVGTLQQDKTMFALVRADANLYRVAPGNYLGTNFGKIMEITETEVSVKELVQDAGGDWIERTSSLQLAEQEATRR